MNILKNKVIQDCIYAAIQNGITVTIEMFPTPERNRKLRPAVLFDGFYKSGTVAMYTPPQGSHVVAHDRYGS